MKKLTLLFTFILLKTAAIAMPSDTTIVEFDDKQSKNKVKIITNKKTIELPKALNLDNVLKAIGVDSSERNRALVLINKGSGKNDTLLVLSREGQKIKIVTKEIVKDTTIAPSKDSDTIEARVEDDDNNGTEEKDRNYEPKPRKPRKFFSSSDFGIYLGINGLRNTDDNEPLSDLRTFRSRYVALSFRKNATLVRGKNADLAFSYGPEIAWYNFMLQNSNVFRYDETTRKTSIVTNTKETEKSKLVMPYVNLPMMFNLGFKESKFKMGVGGYVGYRVGGHTTERFERRGKSKIDGRFGLENTVYGLTAEIGKKSGWTLFGRYDLGDLFRSNQTQFKDVKAFSVGIRL